MKGFGYHSNFIRHIEEYEELESTNVDDTPIVPAGKPSIYLSEATLVPQKWPLQCSYALLDISLGESEEMNEELTVCLESEVMDPNDGEKQDGDMSSTMERVKSVTKNGVRNAQLKYPTLSPIPEQRRRKTVQPPKGSPLMRQ